MKKILTFLFLILNIHLVNAEFNFTKCNNGIINNCPNFVIGKIGNFRDFEELNFSIGKEKNFVFDTKNNYVLLENKLEKFNKTILYSKYLYNFEPKILQKGKIFLIDMGGISDINNYDNNELKKYYLSILEKNKSSVLTDSYQGFLEIQCKNDKIILGKNNNISFDATLKPQKLQTFNFQKLQNYLQNNIKTCKNFYKLFEIKEENGYKYYPEYEREKEEYKKYLQRKFGEKLEKIKKLGKTKQVLEKIENLRSKINLSKKLKEEKEKINILLDSLEEILKK